MIYTRQTTRRSFLSSLAILSAGVAVGSPVDVFSNEDPRQDLEDQWQNFWKRHGGKLLNREVAIKIHASINPCSGHKYRVGQVVYFPHDNILAQPTWIFWGAKKNKPSDVVIAFFKNEEGHEKILRVNRFEFEAMHVLFPGKEESKWRPVRNAINPRHAFIESEGWGLQVKTIVSKMKEPQIFTSLSKDGLTIEKKLFYHIKHS
jgi:hypothetical protein